MTKIKGSSAVKQRYLNHEQLGISFAEWGALWAFKAIGEAGIVLRESYKEDDKYGAMEHGAHLFNMGVACQKHHCGSVTCIGGTVGLFIKHPDPSRYVSDQEGSGRTLLTPLYFPEWKNGKVVRLKLTKADIKAGDTSNYNWRRITVTMAAKAVDNFLRTGEPNWDSVIPKSWRQ